MAHIAYPARGIWSRLRAVAVAGALMLSVGACGDDENGDRTTTGGPDGATTTDTTTTLPRDPDGGTTTTDPGGPDIQLFTLPECSVVPNGARSGADALTIFVAVRNGGPGRLDRSVPVTMQSDTGLRSRVNAGISTGSSFNALQVDVSARDYNQDHRFTITADPDNEIVERDESNNRLTVTVRLPARPASSRDVPCTAP